MAYRSAFVTAPAVSPRAILAFRSNALGRPFIFHVAGIRHSTLRHICCQTTNAGDDAPFGTAYEADPPHTPSPPVSPPPNISTDTHGTPVLEDSATETSSVDPVSEEQNTETPGVVSDSAAQETSEEKRDTGERRRRRRSRVKREVTLPLEDLTAGMELEGTVRGVTQYGAFIGDMGTPTDGLLHVSQLAAGFVENVSDVVNVGDKVKVRVLSVDLEKKTFSLTMKTAEEMAQPRSRMEKKDNSRGTGASRREENKKKWEAFTFNPDKFVDAKILSLTDFGAFCQLLDENGAPLDTAPTDGLIHISELSVDRVKKVSDVLTIGDIVKVRVLATDPTRNRISMSLKPVHAEPELTKIKGQESKQDVSKGMEAAKENQPTFKTSFELAFERAGTTADN